MKKIKKIFAALLAMTMVLGMGVTTFASARTDLESVTTLNAAGTIADTGTITVKGVTVEAGVQAMAYQIVKAEYDITSGKFKSNYLPLYDDLKDNNGKLDTTKLQSPSVLSGLAAKLTEEGATLSNQVVQGFASKAMTATSDNNGFELTGVPVGSYLVVIKGGETNFYTPVVVSVSYVAKSNGNNAGSGIQSDTLTLQDGNAWVKKSMTPVVTKTSTTPNGKLTNKPANVDGRSVNIGEAIDYTVEVNPIPDYNDTNPRFEIVDTLSEGMEFVMKEGTLAVPDVKVYVGSIADQNKLPDTYYTITQPTTNPATGVADGKQRLSINFVTENAGTKTYTLKTPLNDTTKLTGQKLIVTYQAKVVSVTNINSTAKENGVVLNYTRDSNLTDDGGNDTTEEKKTYNYTFDLSTEINGSITESILNKVGEESTTSTNTKPLAGAVFTLYTDESCADDKEYHNTASVTGKVNNVDTVIFDGTHATSADGGKLIVTGLAAGTYYMKETAAPSGYSINNTKFKIEIAATYYTKKEGVHEAGELKNWTITITDPSKAAGQQTTTATITAGKAFNGTARVEIKNTHLSSLPSTGGIGTTIFTIGGCAIMILAAGLYFASRRRSAK